MTPERWQEIEHILDAVMPLDAAARAARLDALCGEDQTLRVQVEEMMGFCEQVSNEAFLEEPPHLAAQDMLIDSFLNGGAEAELPEGATVGPYTIVRSIGHGGMGEVYLAERADPHMQVALKIVKRGMDTREILQRFRYEREILARLNHPNIAQLHGGGVTDDGRPYFAMEYVEGTSLEAYCDTHHLAVTERLTLFKTVCEAVRYAHRHLVVHRDLKPGNILVTEDEEGKPLVKLLDFGIAKLIEEDPTMHTVPMTEMGQRRMTPGYAAPEQVRGQPTTPATDVYALGVILYRLLTGRRPYYFEDRSVTGIESVICLTTPDRPSTVVVRPLRSSGDGAPTTTPEALGEQRATSPRLLRRQLTGDLDAITMMALRKEPERRYASAAEFLDDIQRFLDSRPVLAQHDSLAYRATKFVQRHTAGVSIAAAVVLLITALVAFYTAQLAEQRDLAEQEAARAISTRDFMVGTFELANPDAVPDPRAELGETFTKQELIEANLSRIDELHDPLDQATVMEGMAKAYISYGFWERADSLYRAAFDLKRSALGPEHPDLSESLHGLGLIAQNQRDNQKADSLYRRALEVVSGVFVGDRRRKELIIQNDLAFVLGRQQHLDEARLWYERALALGNALVEEAGEDRELQLLRAKTRRGLATVLNHQGHLDAAEQWFRNALALLQETLGDEHPEIANTMYALAILLVKKEAFTEAEQYYKQALAIYQKRYPPGHLTLSNSYYVLAQLYHRYLPDYAKADSFYRMTVDLERTSADTLSRAYTLTGYGQLLSQRGETRRAEPHLREALTYYQLKLSPEAYYIAFTRYWLGFCLVDVGDYSAAEDHLLRSYATLKAYHPDRQALQQDVLAGLLRLYETWPRPDSVAVYKDRLGQLQAGMPAQEE